MYEEDGKPFYIATYFGGLNGGGSGKKWVRYLDVIKSIMDKFEHSWLIELWNDCCDDVWYLTIAFEK